MKNKTRTYKANVYVSLSDLTCHKELKALYDELGLEQTLYQVWGFDNKVNYHITTGEWYEAEELLHISRAGTKAFQMRYSGYERTDPEWLATTYPIKCSESAKLAARGDASLINEIQRLGKR